MSVVTANPATPAPTIRADQLVGHAVRDRRAEPSRLWVLLVALADAGALIDPSGALTAHRLARVREQQRHGRR